MESREGVQQGDPLGPLVFSLAVQSLIKKCKSQLNTWYLDDGTVGGSAEDVFHDLSKIKEAEDALGLKLNAGKCEYFELPKSQEGSISNETKLTLSISRKKNCLFSCFLSKNHFSQGRTFDTF